MKWYNVRPSVRPSIGNSLYTRKFQLFRDNISVISRSGEAGWKLLISISVIFMPSAWYAVSIIKRSTVRLPVRRRRMASSEVFVTMQCLSVRPSVCAIWCRAVVVLPANLLQLLSRSLSDLCHGAARAIRLERSVWRRVYARISHEAVSDWDIWRASSVIYSQLCKWTDDQPHFTIFWCMLHMTMAWSSSGGVVIRYLLPVLYLTSWLSASRAIS